MGVYPEYTFEGLDGSQYRTPPIHLDAFVAVVSEPGLQRRVTYTMTERAEIRDNCYCCSCGDREGSDAACRNHGFAGQRPCETHNMPGQEWGDEASSELEGSMPESVQAERAKRNR